MNFYCSHFTRYIIAHQIIILLLYTMESIYAYSVIDKYKGVRSLCKECVLFRMVTPYLHGLAASRLHTLFAPQSRAPLTVKNEYLILYCYFKMFFQKINQHICSPFLFTLLFPLSSFSIFRSLNSINLNLNQSEKVCLFYKFYYFIFSFYCSVMCLKHFFQCIALHACCILLLIVIDTV